MTEPNETSAPDPANPATTEPADAATRVEAAVEKEYRTLDDFTPEQLKVINEHTKSERSAAVTGYVEKQKASGTGATMADIDAALERRDAEHRAKDEARSVMEQTLFNDHGISVGSEDYRKFSKASGSFKVESLRTPEGIALIVKAADIRTPKAQADAARTGVDHRYSPKAYDGTELVGIPPTGISIKDMNKE